MRVRLVFLVIDRSHCDDGLWRLCGVTKTGKGCEKCARKSKSASSVVGLLAVVLKAWLEENNKDVRVFVGDMLSGELLQRHFEGRSIIAV
jgi:hypothetical protein